MSVCSRMVREKETKTTKNNAVFGVKCISFSNLNQKLARPMKHLMTERDVK